SFDLPNIHPSLSCKPPGSRRGGHRTGILLPLSIYILKIFILTFLFFICALIFITCCLLAVSFSSPLFIFLYLLHFFIILPILTYLPLFILACTFILFLAFTGFIRIPLLLFFFIRSIRFFLLKNQDYISCFHLIPFLYPYFFYFTAIRGGYFYRC